MGESEKLEFHISKEGKEKLRELGKIVGCETYEQVIEKLIRHRLVGVSPDFKIEFLSSTPL